jgi:DNA-directed RNA polymerase specialized sigma24 family protein
MQGESDQAAREALSSFCEQYRPAIHRFFVRRGCSTENADDYTQEFFFRKILEPWKERKTFLLEARRSEDGRFRSFLCWMLWHFLHDQQNKGGMRGGGKVIHISLEDWLPMEEGGDEKAFAHFGREFDRVLATEIIQRAAARSKHSKYLKAHLRGEIPQRVAAESLKISEEAFKLAYHRFRKRLAENLREEIAKLVGPDENEIQQEIKYLMSLFAESAA